MKLDGFHFDDLNFLKEEFGVTKEQLEKFDLKDWCDLREKCFDIEVEEALLASEAEENSNDPNFEYEMPKREKIALRLCETPLEVFGF